LVRVEIRDGDRTRRLLQERGPIDERAVGVAAEEILREQLVEADDVRRLDRADVVSIERDERVEIGIERHASSVNVCDCNTRRRLDECLELRVKRLDVDSPRM